MATQYYSDICSVSGTQYGVKADPYCSPFNATSVYIQQAAKNLATNSGASVGDIIEIDGDGNAVCFDKYIVWQVNTAPVNYNYANLTLVGQYCDSRNQ